MSFVLKVNGAAIKYSSNYNSGYASKVNIAVKDMSFCVESGDYCCIVGMNGSGKSSLIKGILGLIPLSSGAIEYGVERGKISYMPQINSIPHDFPATVKEIVLTGAQKSRKNQQNHENHKKSIFSAFCSLCSFYSKEDLQSANNSMDVLKIKDLEKKRFGELSGGQQQKVLLARALCKNPSLLILDEPCAGLDKNAIDSFYALLYNLNNNLKVTVLMISHDLHDVQKYAKHIIEMNTELLFYGTAEEWAEWKKLEKHNKRSI
jgi:zinc transport system ATP-binding protein